MRNALVIVIVCLSVSLLYDVYKEPIDRLLHLDQTETNETAETGNRKQKTKKQAQKPDGQQHQSNRCLHINFSYQLHSATSSR